MATYAIGKATERELMADVTIASTGDGPSMDGGSELVECTGAHGQVGGGGSSTMVPWAALADQLEGTVGYRVQTSDCRVVGRLASVYHDPADGRPDALTVLPPGWQGCSVPTSSRSSWSRRSAIGPGASSFTSAPRTPRR